jgi:hypothetical protein
MTKEELLKMIGCEPDTMAKVDCVIKNFNSSRVNPAKEEPKKQLPMKPEHTQKAPLPENANLEDGPVDEKAQAALKAVVRILTPLKESLSPLLIHEVLDAAGFNLAASKSDEGEEMNKGATMSPEPVKEEHKIEAMKIAKDAYKAHMAKLGYQKYPTEQMAQKAVDPDEAAVEKAVNTDPDEPGQDEEQEGNMHNPDVEKSAVIKSALAKVPKEARGLFEVVLKSNEDLKMKLEAVTKSARRKDFIEKAEGFKNLGVPTSELADTLLELAEVAPKQAEKIEKMLRAADEQIAKGGLFSEFGSNQSGAGIGSWDAIEQAAVGYVAKSGKTMSKPEAIENFLDTGEGKRMYSEYMKSHASSK